MENENNGFRYTYSAKEQEEVRAIREKYTERPATEESAMERLRRLDGAVTKKGTVVSLIFGVVGALLMGSGMSMVMTSFGAWLGFSTSVGTLVGILVGIVGLVLVCLAYPMYTHVIKRERKKIAPEILRLTDELMK